MYGPFISLEVSNSRAIEIEEQLPVISISQLQHSQLNSILGN